MQEKGIHEQALETEDDITDRVHWCLKPLLKYACSFLPKKHSSPIPLLVIGMKWMKMLEDSNKRFLQDSIKECVNDTSNIKNIRFEMEVPIERAFEDSLDPSYHHKIVFGALTKRAHAEQVTRCEQPRKPSSKIDQLI